MTIRTCLAILAATALSLTGLAAGRLSTHYPEVHGTVGQALVNPDTGMPYLDKDLMDFADGDWGDEEIAISGMPPGLFFDKSRKIAGRGMPWYESDDSYHPLSGTPTTAGTYILALTASWRDGVRESVTIRFVIAGSAAPAPAPTSGRLQTHYATIRGKVGEQLVNPETGTPYLDKDLCDFADGDWGDETISISGMPDGLSFDKKQKIAGVGKPWYESDDKYHPLAGAPRKAGTYRLVISASWRDGVRESVSITIVIEDAQASVAPDAETLRRAFAKALVLREGIWNGDDVEGLVEVKIGKINKKGQVKVSAKAYLADGRTVSAPAATATVAYTEEGGHAFADFEVPVAFKKSDIALTLGVSAWLEDGAPTYSLYSTESSGDYWVDWFNEPLDRLEPGCALHLGDFALPLPEGFELDVDRLPEGVGVSRSGTKLVCEANAAAFKLTYQSRTQIFKGTFTAFAEMAVDGRKPKVKKYKVRLSGIVYRGMGFGMATCGKLGSWAVRIAP